MPDSERHRESHEDPLPFRKGGGAGEMVCT